MRIKATHFSRNMAAVVLVVSALSVAAHSADDKPAAPSAYTADDIELVHKSLDGHLARSLKDPSSAQSYAVSGIVPCSSVSRTGKTLTDKNCVCYDINAKNSMGGYSGIRRGVAMLVHEMPAPFFLETPEALHTAGAFSCPGMEPRDADLIRAQVQ